MAVAGHNTRQPFYSPEFQAKLFFTRNWVVGFYWDILLKLFLLLSESYKLYWLLVRLTNRVIEFACFDLKLQYARNTCGRKQAKRRECVPRVVSQHSIYLRSLTPNVRTVKGA